MELWVLFGTFVLLMLIGTPIAFCLGVAAFATALYMKLPPLVIFQQVNSGMNIFTLLAVPFFIYAGDLMVRGGIAQRIIDFAGSLIGHVRGGMGQVNIATATKKKLFSDYKGRRYYFCCPGCPAMFKKNPAKYAKKELSIPIPKKKA